MPWAASVMARSWPATSWIRGRLVVAVPPAAEAPLAVGALVTVTGAGVSLVAVALVAVRALPVVAPRGRCSSASTSCRPRPGLRAAIPTPPEWPG